MQSYWFLKQSKINIIYNISVITITITMSIILANFGKYAISDCPFIFLCWFNGLSVCLFVRLFIRSRITLEPFQIFSPKLVHRCILVPAPSLFLFKVKGQGHEVTAKVKIRNRSNSVNFWATAKFKKPQCSTPQGPSLRHQQLPVSLPVQKIAWGRKSEMRNCNFYFRQFST